MQSVEAGPAVPVRPGREVALDQIRACAVIAVMSFHVVQMSPVRIPALDKVAHYGQFGVDLFFVLSGWLIGRLYWREMNTFGNVSILRFWGRRWIRTLPPYFVILLVSWLGVWWARGEKFDFGYLAFWQNYYEPIPYFLVSWSLCVEEHFYLAAPIIAGLLSGFLPRKALWGAWLALLLLSPYFRWVEWHSINFDEVGYGAKATHLRLDGLVIGFGLSYLVVFLPNLFDKIASKAMFAAFISLVSLVCLEYAGGIVGYILWPLALAIFGAALVAAGVSVKRAPAKPSLIPWTSIAVASYSAYLVHPIAIHVARSVLSQLSGRSWLLYWPIVVTIIILSTAAFYLLVEKPSIVIRDLRLKSRSKSRQVLVRTEQVRTAPEILPTVAEPARNS